MKNIKSFQQFNGAQIHMTNEELLGFSKAERSNKKKAIIQKALDKYVPVWTRNKKISEPTKEELVKFWADAEADGFASGEIEEGAGGVGFDQGAEKLRYRKLSDIKVGYKRHSFGSGE